MKTATELLNTIGIEISLGLDMREMKPRTGASPEIIFNSFERPLKDIVVKKSTILKIMYSQTEEYEEIRTVLDFGKRWVFFLIMPNNAPYQDKEPLIMSVTIIDDDWHFDLIKLEGNTIPLDGDRLHRFVVAI